MRTSDDRTMIEEFFRMLQWLLVTLAALAMVGCGALVYGVFWLLT